MDDDRLAQTRPEGVITPVFGFEVQELYGDTGLASYKRSKQHPGPYGSDLETKDANGRTLLLTAESPRKIKLLLEAGANVSASDPRGNTLLHIVCTHIYGESGEQILEAALEHGANINAQNKDGLTALHVALESWELEKRLVDYLIKSGADVNIEDNNGNTALHYACKGDVEDIDRVPLLVKAGANVNRQNKQGQTCLHNLGDTDSIDPEHAAIKCLKSAGLSLEIRDLEGSTAFLANIRQHSSQSAEVLLEHGARIDAHDNKGRRCTHLSTDSHMLDLFLRRGANASWHDSDGNNALHAVSMNFDLQADEFKRGVKICLEHGININSKNSHGRTILHNLAYRPFVTNWYTNWSRGRDVIFALRELRTDIDINAADIRGYTPLHLAAATSEVQVYGLLAAGARYDVFSVDSRSPLHVACRARDPNTLRMLLRLGRGQGLSIVNHQDSSGATALHDACRSGVPESVEALLEYGADVGVLDEEGYTPLHACSRFALEEEIWKQLTSATAESDKGVLQDEWRPVDKNDRPQIMDTSLGRIGEAVQILLHHGADLESRTADGRTPLDLALSVQCQEMVEILREILNAPLHDTLQLNETEHRSLKQPIAEFFDSLRTSIDDNEYIYGHGSAFEATERFVSSTNKSLLLETLMQTDEDTKLPVMSLLVRHGRVDVLRAPPGEFQLDRILRLFQSTRDTNPADFSSLILVASERPVCNIGVLRLLVERFGIDVNTRERKIPVFEGTSRPSARLSLKKSIVGTALHHFAMAEFYWHLDAVEFLLQKGADIDARDGQGNTPLMIACSTHVNKYKERLFRIPVAELLLQKGADPNAANLMGETALHKASADPEMVRLLIKNGADVSAEGRPLLAAAIEALDVDTVKIYLEAGMDCNKPYKADEISEQSGLEHLSLNKRDKKKGYSDDEQQYPLLYAAVGSWRQWQLGSFYDEGGCRRKSCEIVQLLLSHGADWTIRLDDGLTILHRIILDDGIFEPFCERNDVDWNMRDDRGVTVFLTACGLATRFSGHDSHPWSQILDAGGDLNLVDWEGRGVLHYLLKNTDGTRAGSEVANFLERILEKDPGFDVTRKDKAGYSPLHVAMEECYKQHIQHSWTVKRGEQRPEHHRGWVSIPVLNSLVSQGANLTEPDPQGATALHYLSRLVLRQSSAVMAVIALFERCLNLGMDVNAQDLRGHPPLFWLLDSDLIPFMSGDLPLLDIEKLFRDADFLARDTLGRNALHVIAGRKQSDRSDDEQWSEYTREKIRIGRTQLNVNLFKWIMEKGVDPLEQSSLGESSLDIAANTGKSEILNLVGSMK